MDYNKGDIIRKNNIKFKDSLTIDIKIGGRPVVILIDAKDNAEYIYYLTLTSKLEKYISNEDKYFLVGKGGGSGLNKPSMINLSFIYKDKKTNIITTGLLSEHDYNEMIKKFIICHTVNEDEYFSELIEYLEEDRRKVVSS